MKKLLMIIFTLNLLVGCAVNSGKSLLVVTATNAGITVGVNELTQMPECKLGYNRLEGSVVPVSKKNIYTVPTLARLNFSSVFKNPDIESLIATGDAANTENLQNKGMIQK